MGHHDFAAYFVNQCLSSRGSPFGLRCTTDERRRIFSCKSGDLWGSKKHNGSYTDSGTDISCCSGPFPTRAIPIIEIVGNQTPNSAGPDLAGLDLAPARHADFRPSGLHWNRHLQPWQARYRRPHRWRRAWDIDPQEQEHWDVILAGEATRNCNHAPVAGLWSARMSHRCLGPIIAQNLCQMMIKMAGLNPNYDQ
jgi:hypothetical protein